MCHHICDISNPWTVSCFWFKWFVLFASISFPTSGTSSSCSPFCRVQYNAICAKCYTAQQTGHIFHSKFLCSACMMSFYRYFWYLKTGILGPWEVLVQSLNFVLSVCYEPCNSLLWHRYWLCRLGFDIVCQNLCTANLEDVFLNICPNRIISFIYAIGLTNKLLNCSWHDIAAICMLKMPFNPILPSICWTFSVLNTYFSLLWNNKM